MNFVLNLILTLVGVIIGAISAIEDFIRTTLAGSGLDPQMQNITMIVVALLLIIAAYRIFGGILGILCTAFLLLLILHILEPGLVSGIQHGAS